jgi:hypothetical protein
MLEVRLRAPTIEQCDYSRLDQMPVAEGLSTKSIYDKATLVSARCMWINI